MTDPTANPASTSLMDGVSGTTVPTSVDIDAPNGLIPNHVYDVLKWVAIIVMPALATFVVGLGGIWGIPYTGQVASTITAAGVLLGAFLGVSSVKYNSK